MDKNDHSKRFLTTNTEVFFEDTDGEKPCCSPEEEKSCCSPGTGRTAKGTS
jgi:hypothetical protein